ncbi:hypothetical protein BS78_05G056200 [Paspalum vaginatum]|nr:hypothetical protein BS78_05G056200 [Paspalum vaginatum]
MEGGGFFPGGDGGASGAALPADPNACDETAPGGSGVAARSGSTTASAFSGVSSEGGSSSHMAAASAPVARQRKPGRWRRFPRKAGHPHTVGPRAFRALVRVGSPAS